MVYRDSVYILTIKKKGRTCRFLRQTEATDDKPFNSVDLLFDDSVLIKI